MSQRGNPTWFWFGLGAVCIFLTAVQFFDLLRRNDFLTDAIFFFLSLGLAVGCMRKWAEGDHAGP